jgi:hypothetical protein
MSISLPILGVPGPLDGGGGLNYSSLLKDTYGLNLVWRLTDGAGAVAPEADNAAYNGAATGVDWANTPGPGALSGESAPYFDGSNDYIDLLTAALIAAFDGDQLSLLMWIKPDSAFDTTRTLAMFNDGTSQRNWLYTTNAPATTSQHRFNTVSAAGSLSDWHMVTATFSKDGTNYLYIDKTQYSGAGTNVSLSTLSTAVVGATTTVPANPWKGWLCYVGLKFGTPVLSAANVASIYDAVAG